MSLQELISRREVLSKNLLIYDDAPAIIEKDWIIARIWITNWWRAYKAWEATDTFNNAVLDDRMTMRSFGSDFQRQVNKAFPNITIAPSKFYADSQLGRLSVDERLRQDDAFKLAAHGTYNAKRGIDSSAFQNPANFQNRATKYQHGLHDVSVKLLVKNLDVKGQSHHQAEPNPHFSFLPLSKGEDQEVIYKLSQYAKALKFRLPQLHELIHGYRTQMSRVKLANDYDMGTGYSAVPTPGRPDGLGYKVSYGLGNTIKKRGRTLPVATTVDILRERQQAYFEHRASIARTGNEIVIAIRQHAGPFPVYAYDDGSAQLKCFDIVLGQKVLNGRTISRLGRANW